VKLPLASLENPPRRTGNEAVIGGTDFGEGVVHCFGDLVWCVARQIFLQSISEQATPRLLSPSRKAFRAFKQVVRNRNGCFHTFSITVDTACIKGRLFCSAPAVLSISSNGVSRGDRLQTHPLGGNAVMEQAAGGEELGVEQGGAGGAADQVVRKQRQLYVE